MNKRVVLATGNVGKVSEMQLRLSTLGCSVLPQSDFNIGEAIENGLSFVENAIIKARFASQHTNLPAIADDSGIEVDALNGEPGIYSARFAQRHDSGSGDLDNNVLLLNRLKNEVSRRARFRCVLVYMRHATDPTPIVAHGCWEGEIAMHPRGNNGFGYDPVFFVPELGKTAAELSPEEKKQLSHRGQALDSLVSQLAII